MYLSSLTHFYGIFGVNTNNHRRDTNVNECFDPFVLIERDYYCVARYSNFFITVAALEFYLNNLNNYRSE